jgi:hypothetical protein
MVHLPRSGRLYLVYAAVGLIDLARVGLAAGGGTGG